MSGITEQLPTLSKEALMELLSGLIQHEQREVHKLRPSMVHARRFADVTNWVSRVALAVKSETDIGRLAMLEPFVDDQIDKMVHTRPLFRRFLDAHLPRSTVATKRAIEGAMYKGAVKGGLWTVGLVIAPEVAIPAFLLKALWDAALEYELVVRNKQQAQDLERAVRSRNGRIGFYHQLQRTLVGGGSLTPEQVRRIAEFQGRPRSAGQH